MRYSAYQQKIQLPTQFMNCNNINPDFLNTFPTPRTSSTNFVGAAPAASRRTATPTAKLRWRSGKELAQGAVFVSLVGYGFTYNTLDNNRNPTSGLLVDLSQDFAGVGGDVNFIKSTADIKLYNEILPDIVGLFRLQAGHATGWGGQDLRMLDHFQGGPNLVRGFAPAGFGPRDLTPGTNQDALGGSIFWAATSRVPDAAVVRAEGFRHEVRDLRRCRPVAGLQGPDVVGTDRRDADHV